MQQAREDKRERLELTNGVFEFERMGKHRCGLFDMQVPLGPAGRELLKFDSRLAQTFGNTGDWQRGKLRKGTNTPEPQRLQHLRDDFPLEIDQRIVETI